MTVAELLQASRAAHKRYRQHAGRVGPDGKVLTPGDAGLARSAVLEAHALRVAADTMDPGRTDPDWRNDAVPHTELLAFYTTYLTTP